MVRKRFKSRASSSQLQLQVQTLSAANSSHGYKPLGRQKIVIPTGAEGPAVALVHFINPQTYSE
jgi:hypothetical protein